MNIEVNYWYLQEYMAVRRVLTHVHEGVNIFNKKRE